MLISSIMSYLCRTGVHHWTRAICRDYVIGIIKLNIPTNAMKYNASKIVKNAPQEEVIPKHHSMPERTPQRLMRTDADIDRILQARLKQIE